ncbi:MAG: penicillin-binding transpeptidase domain-containing protein [Bacillota bacterium]
MRKHKGFDVEEARGKFAFLVFVFIAVLCVYMGRIMYYKLEFGAEFEALAKNQQINRYDMIITPNRGSILDRNQQILAVSTAVYNVVLDPLILAEYGNNVAEQEKTIQALCETFEALDPDVLWNYIAENPETGTINLETHWKYLVKGVERSVKEELEAMNLKAVHFEQDSQRAYPLKTTASHLIGFVRGGSSWGIERQYNSYMSGSPGRSFILYEGVNNMTYQEHAAQDGHTVVTTIDYMIQKFAEEVVAETYETWPSQSVAAIVMNPNTGEILAMADQNQFDLNSPDTPPDVLSDPEFAVAWSEMTDTEQMNYYDKMWRNFSVADTYEPGSTYKPEVVAAALEEGVIKESDTFFCSGGIEVADYYIGCHYNIGHGELNVEQIMAYSCNPCMVQIGQRLGAENFYEYQKSYGFGELTGIDLPTEAYGVLHAQNAIGPTELATMSIGQTFNATSIQSMTAFASLINGGELLEPYVVSKIIDQNGAVVMERTPEIVRKTVSEETSDYIREALRSTVLYGTGKTIDIPGYSIGCKTGTAEQGDRARSDLWTLSHMTYFPVENPQYLIFTVIHLPEEYGSGIQSTAPMTLSLLEKIIKYKNIQPSIETEEETILTSNPTVVVGDYTNEITLMVVSDLVVKDLNYKVVGTGNTVVNQVPKGGTTVEKGSEVILYVEKSEEDYGTQGIPNLVGKTYDEASQTLSELGFGILVEGELSGIVTSQNPAHGIFVAPGEDVTLRTEPMPESDVYTGEIGGEVLGETVGDIEVTVETETVETYTAEEIGGLS